MKTRLLRRERSIQIGGIIFILSPFCNFLLAVAMVKNVSDPWSAHGLSIIAQHISLPVWMLNICSVVIGLMMAKGRRNSWALVLVLLGIYILRNSFTYMSDIKEGWIQPTLAMLINAASFALVYVQEFHQQVYGIGGPSKPNPKPQPAAPAATVMPFKPVEPLHPTFFVRLPMVVDFKGLGTWARITYISGSEIRMRGLSDAFPVGVDTATCELLCSHK